MASFFKYSCIVFWIGWLFFFSYVIGIEYYIDQYLSPSRDVKHAEYFIILLCVFNLFYCWIGCCFIKCNVVHTFFCLCYMLPLLTVNVLGTTFGIFATRKASRNFPSVPELRDYISNDNYREWLSSIEKNVGCCGLMGYWDHPAFISNHHTNTTVLSAYIPTSCCKTRHRGLCLNLLDASLEERDSVSLNSVKGLTLTEIANRTKCSVEEKQDKLISTLYQDNTNIFYPNRSIAAVIYTCGCYKDMQSAHSNVYDNAHTVFYIFNSFTVFLMLVVYIRSFCVIVLLPTPSTNSLGMDDLTHLRVRIQPLLPKRGNTNFHTPKRMLPIRMDETLFETLPQCNICTPPSPLHTQPL